MKWFYTMFSDENVKFIPSQARLDVCTLCQLNCTSCYMRNDSRQTTGIGYVALDKFEAFLDNNPSLKHIEISNSGEPFLHPQMHELIRMAYDHGVELSCRNGTNFNNVSDEVIEDIVECGFTAIAFSVDGVTQEAYAKYRRNGNVEKVFGNIKSLIEAKKRHGAQLPDLVWQFVLMSHNIHEIQAAETKAKELGIRIRFRDTWNLPERKKVQEMLGKKVEAALSDKKNTFYDYCKDLFTMPQVNWDGRLLGCCQIYRSDWGVNVFSEGLVETVNSERYRNTLLNLASGTAVTDLSIPCSTCRWQPGNSRNTSCEKA
jgi:MoaA/NifB/PqqE/SkfB family radical SAM enzyme